MGEEKNINGGSNLVPDSEKGWKESRYEPLTYFIPYLTDIYAPEIVNKRKRVYGGEGAYSVALLDLGGAVISPSVLGKTGTSWMAEDQQKYEEAIATLKTDNPDYYRYYWSIHAPDYLERLDGLVKSIKMPLIDEQVKAVIAIAAMNETQLQRTYEAIKKSYGEDFEKEINVIIYHNFKQTPDTEVQDAINTIKTHSNVSVIEEQVPEYSNAGVAKKVASDVAIRSMKEGRKVPLIMMDADIVDITPGMIQASLAALETPKNLAVSPNFTFDHVAAEKLPVLGLVWDLEKYLDFSDVAKYQSKNTIGAFTVINPGTLLAVGGYMPVLKEDMLLSDRLRMLTQSWVNDSWNPVGDLREQQHLISVDPSRQIYNLLQGRSANAHWKAHNEEYSQQVSAMRRFDWKSLEKVPDIPELGDYTESNIQQVVSFYWNKNYQFAVNFIEKDKEAEYRNVLARNFLSFFKDRGIEVYAWITKADGKPYVVTASQVLADQDSDWEIVRIDGVKITNPNNLTEDAKSR